MIPDMPHEPAPLTLLEERRAIGIAKLSLAVIDQIDIEAAVRAAVGTDEALDLIAQLTCQHNYGEVNEGVDHLVARLSGEFRDLLDLFRRVMHGRMIGYLESQGIDSRTLAPAPEPRTPDPGL